MVKLAQSLAAITLSLLVLSGCGSSSGTSMLPPTPDPLGWQDGNPLVSVCPTGVTVNCKTDYTVQDETTGATVEVPIDVNSKTQGYTAPDKTHKYSVRANGYDWQGQPISSEYVEFP